MDSDVFRTFTGLPPNQQLFLLRVIFRSIAHLGVGPVLDALQRFSSSRSARRTDERTVNETGRSTTSSALVVRRVTLRTESANATTTGSTTGWHNVLQVLPSSQNDDVAERPLQLLQTFPNNITGGTGEGKRRHSLAFGREEEDAKRLKYLPGEFGPLLSSSPSVYKCAPIGELHVEPQSFIAEDSISVYPNNRADAEFETAEREEEEENALQVHLGQAEVAARETDPPRLLYSLQFAKEGEKAFVNVDDTTDNVNDNIQYKGFTPRPLFDPSRTSAGNTTLDDQEMLAEPASGSILIFEAVAVDSTGTLCSDDVVADSDRMSEFVEYNIDQQEFEINSTGERNERAAAGQHSTTRPLTHLPSDIVDNVVGHMEREDWQSLALTCKTFRRYLYIKILFEEHVLQSTHLLPGEPTKVEFKTVSSFSALNRHWRRGPLFKPIETIIFQIPFAITLPYSEERSKCLQHIISFLLSLPPGQQHIRKVHLSLGMVSFYNENYLLDHSTISDLLRHLHLTGCHSLSVVSHDVDLHGPGNSIPPDFSPNVLQMSENLCMPLKMFEVNSGIFSHPALTPWFLSQFRGPLDCSPITDFTLWYTGFTDHQLDSLFAYFRLPSLIRFTVQGMWLETIIELLQFSDEVAYITFHGLSNTVLDGAYVASLRNLCSITGSPRDLLTFIPVLHDVDWENFPSLDMTCVDLDGHKTFPGFEATKVLEELASRNAGIESVDISFPALQCFTSPFFESGAQYKILGHLKIRYLTVWLFCKSDIDAVAVLDAMQHWLVIMAGVKEVTIRCIGLKGKISSMDKFGFRSAMEAKRPGMVIELP